MSFAVSLVSSSCDHYCLSWDGIPEPADIIKRLLCFDEELKHLSIETWDLNVSGLSNEEYQQIGNTLQDLIISIIDDAWKESEEHLN